VVPAVVGAANEHSIERLQTLAAMVISSAFALATAQRVERRHDDPPKPPTSGSGRVRDPV
jgi:hypothetical protein